MRKLLSVNYSPAAFNIAMLLLRIALGILMLNHGYDKLVHFNKYADQFMNFMGLGKTVSLALVVFSELFCSFFLIIGLFTRFALIPLIITMLVAFFKAHNGDVFGEGEHALLYLGGYLALLLVGPGKASIDNMIGK